MTTQFANLQQAVDTLTATVQKLTSAEDGATVLINSIPDLIQSAVNDALQKGAPPSTLSAFGTLNDVLTQKAAALAAAVAANTSTTTAPPPATVLVPAVTEADGSHISQSDYEGDLAAAGFVLGTVTQADGTPTSTPSGDVISTNPTGEVAAGSSVDIVVAQ